MGLPPKEYAEHSDWQGLGPQNGSCGAANQTGGVALTMPGSSGEHLGEQTPGSSSSKPSVPIAIPVQATGLMNFASGHKFQNTTLLIIVLNGIWIGIDVQYNHPSLKKNGKLPLEPTSTVVENLFCVYFTFEIVVRILAFGMMNFHEKELRFWFIFDSVLVAFMVIETWIMLVVDSITGGGGNSFLSKFSTLRLLRLTRLTRLLHSLPELLTLVRGMVNATKAVSIVLAFMVMIMYVFAIVFTAQLGDSESPEKKDLPYWIRDADPTGQELFGSMGDSMMSLFTRGLLCDNLAETLEAIKDRAGEYTCTDADENPVSATRTPGDEKVCTRTGGELWLMWVFVLFMIISAMCLLNMLVGILCQVIEETSAEEGASSEISALKHNIEDSFHAVDISGDDAITRSEWKTMRQSQALMDSFTRIGVDDAFMDEQLDQIEEHLFARLDKTHILDDEISWMPKEAEHHEGDEEDKIPLGEFLAHILQIRPDVAASMLDIQILRTRAERDEEYFNHQIDRIETKLETRMRAIRDLPVVPCGALARTEEPNSGTSSSPDAWLRGLSTELLFAELRHRADLLPEASPLAIDLE